MKLRNKIILVIVTLTVLLSTLTIPTFASETNGTVYTTFEGVRGRFTGYNYLGGDGVTLDNFKTDEYNQYYYIPYYVCSTTDYMAISSFNKMELRSGYSTWIGFEFDSRYYCENKFLYIDFDFVHSGLGTIYTYYDLGDYSTTWNEDVGLINGNNIITLDDFTLSSSKNTFYILITHKSAAQNASCFLKINEMAVFDTAEDRQAYIDSKNATPTDRYEEGYNDGYNDGFEEGAENGYYKGFDEGKVEGITEGYSQGLADGYDSGYEQGKADGFIEGVNEQLHATTTPTIAHFENAVIELYRGTKPPQTSNRYHTETVSSTTTPTNIFDMLYVPILDTADGVYDGYTMTITFDDVVHFGENPFCLYLDTEEGYEFNLNDYLTVSFMSSSNEHFNLGDCFYNENGYYYYIPSKYIDSGDIDMVRITMKASLFAKLNDTSFSETTNTLTIVNKPYNVGIISGLILDRYYSNGYDMGYDEGNYDGYTKGKTNGYQLGYDEGYNLGYLASEGGEGFSALFNGIAHVPVTVLTSLLGFEVFGINLMSVLIGLLTILVVVFVIKRFI